MDNQHRKIKGYRELSQAEIDLMNEIKALGPLIQAVVEKVYLHLTMQILSANVEERDRLFAATPTRFAELGKDDLQTGLMHLTRAVAQPTFF